MTMKALTYYIIFGRPPIGGEASPPLPPLWRRHCLDCLLCLLSILIAVGWRSSNQKSNQIRNTHNIHKQKRSQCIVNVVLQVVPKEQNAPLMGHPVTKTIKTDSITLHKIKNYYQNICALRFWRKLSQNLPKNAKNAIFYFNRQRSVAQSCSSAQQAILSNMTSLA